MIRAYVPWYLVRNYLAFAFIACLAALQLAQARQRRERIAVPLAILIGTFLVFYALAPELLTPGPAGGELTFLFGGAALAAVVVHRLVDSGKRQLASGQQAADRPILKFETLAPARSAGVWHLTFPLVSLAVIAFDVPLFHALNSLALRAPWIDVPVQFWMNDYIVPTGLVLALFALWFAGRGANEPAEFRRAVLRALLAMALASVTLKLVNQVYFRPRPFAFDDSVRLLFYHPSDSSMPSNAATVCFSLAAAVWLRQRRWGACMLAVAASMLVARVIGGVHYPADVAAGAWLGVTWAWLVNRAAWLDRPLDAAVGLARRVGLA